MAVASASHAVSTAGGFGPTALCWRLLNMKTIRSPLSRIQMITALETIQSLLENYPCSLNGFERTCLTLFATSVAESMENLPGDPITILPFSTTQDASTDRHAHRRLRVVNNALVSLIPGDWAKYFSAHSNNRQQRISLATFPKSGQEQTTLKDDTLPSLECRSDPE